MAKSGQVQRLEIAGSKIKVITRDEKFITWKEESVSTAQALQAHGVPQSTIVSLQIQVREPFDWRHWLVLLMGVITVVTLIVSLLVCLTLNSVQSAIKKLTGAIAKAIFSPEGERDARNKTRFSEIAGYEKAKAEMFEIIYYLQSPETFTHLQTEVPRNILLVGPPGTGKTQLARAVADTAGVKIFYGSGSRFVELFVGSGAKHVRELFEQAKKEKRAIVFIDEIDALARKRIDGGSSGTQEHDHALNELLTQLDGFMKDKDSAKDKESDIIFIGATNREDVLDPALVQRMHRRIAVPLPKQDAREGILQIHKPDSLVWENGSLADTATRAAGFSGRELGNLMKESGRRTLHRLVEQAHEQCKFGSDEKFWMIPAPDSTLQSPFVFAGRMPAFPDARIVVVLQREGNTECVKTEVIDASNGVWVLPQGLDAGHYNVSVSSYGGGITRGSKRQRLTVQDKVNVEMKDVEAALERLGATIPTINSPVEVERGLDARFPGQQKAKKSVALAASFHYSAIRASLEAEDSETPKAGLLLTGSPGCGKTTLIRCLGRYLGVPFTVCSIRDLADTTGVVNVFRNLILAAQGNPLRAQYGIVCVQNCQLLRRDEADNEGNLARWQLQERLGSLIRGLTVDIPLADGLTQTKIIRVHTGTILFVCEWVLQPPQTVEGRVGPERPSDDQAHSDGTRKRKKKAAAKRKKSDDPANVDDLRHCGIPMELAEQSSVLASMDETTGADAAALFDVNCVGNLAASYVNLLKERGIRLEIESDARQRLAELALEHGDGLYGVNAVMRALCIGIIRESKSEPNLKLDAQMVDELVLLRDPAATVYQKARDNAEAALPPDILSEAVLDD